MRLDVCCFLFLFGFVPSLAAAPVGFAPDSHGYSASGIGWSAQISGGRLLLHSQSGSWPFTMVRANAGARISAAGQSGTRNDFIGNDPQRWRTAVPLYETVRVSSAWPGIDVAYRATERRLEYDFEIAPGADPSRIRLRAESGRPYLDAQGNLHLKSTDGEFVQHRPVTYQIVRGRRVEIASSFVLSGNTIRFRLGRYDRRLSLTIDPAVTFASYLGGGDVDEAHATTVDKDGNLYVAGLTYSTTSAYPNNNAKVMLLKYPPSGSPVVSIFSGTNGNDWANAVVTDSKGNVYLGGQASSTDFPTASSYATPLYGLSDGFVLELDPTNSNLIFGTYIGGTLDDHVNGVAIDSSDNVYAVGATESPDFPTKSGISGEEPYQQLVHDTQDGFLVSYTNAGYERFCTAIGSRHKEDNSIESSLTEAFGVVVDANGYSYVVGSTSSSDFAVTPSENGGAFQASYGGSEDAFALQINSTGTRAYFGTYVGGSGADVGYAVALDSDNNVYIAGPTSSGDFPIPPSGSVYQVKPGGGSADGFVFALRNNGRDRLWSTYMGGDGDDFINAMARDSTGTLWVAGTTTGDFPVSEGAPQATEAGGRDAFLARLSSDGASLMFSTYLGGSADDQGRAVALSGSAVYIAGITASSTDFPVSNAYDSTYSGGSTDAFFAGYGLTPTISTGGVVNGASFQPGAAVAPGSIISIFGIDFTKTASIADTLPLPTKFGDFSVQVNGTNIPLFYAGPTQINAQLPYEVSPGTASITVKTTEGTSNSLSFSVAATGPGIFVGNDTAVVVNQDGTLNSQAKPAKAGDVITVFLTGIGVLDNPVASGAAAPDSPFSKPTATPQSATIGGANAPIYFLGLAPRFVGLAQANLTVPSGLAANQNPLVISIGGVSSAAANVWISP
jgi:uncharacterized protein (TIGR03437 family)